MIKWKTEPKVVNHAYVSFYFSRHLQEIFLAREGLPMTFPFINVSERWIHGSDFKSPYQRIHENCAYQWNSENCVYIYIIHALYICIYTQQIMWNSKTLRTLWDTYTFVYIYIIQYYIYIYTLYSTCIIYLMISKSNSPSDSFINGLV